MLEAVNYSWFEMEGLEYGLEYYFNFLFPLRIKLLIQLVLTSTILEDYIYKGDFDMKS